MYIHTHTCIHNLKTTVCVCVCSVLGVEEYSGACLLSGVYSRQTTPAPRIGEAKKHTARLNTLIKRTESWNRIEMKSSSFSSGEKNLHSCVFSVLLCTLIKRLYIFLNNEYLLTFNLARVYCPSIVLLFLLDNKCILTGCMSMVCKFRLVCSVYVCNYLKYTYTYFAIKLRLNILRIHMWRPR